MSKGVCGVSPFRPSIFQYVADSGWIKLLSLTSNNRISTLKLVLHAILDRHPILWSSLFDSHNLWSYRGQEMRLQWDLFTSSDTFSSVVSASWLMPLIGDLVCSGRPINHQRRWYLSLLKCAVVCSLVQNESCLSISGESFSLPCHTKDDGWVPLLRVEKRGYFPTLPFRLSIILFHLFHSDSL